jgi:hypothetical protein
MHEGAMGMIDSAQGWAAMDPSALLWLALLVLAALAIVWLVSEITGRSETTQRTDDAPDPREY